MLCPNCNTEMTERNYIPPDEDFDICTDYRCPKCHVFKLDGQDWTIPDELKPTEKQERTVAFIHSRLGIPFDGVIETKKEYFNFIAKHFEDAKRKKRPINSREWEDSLNDELMQYLPGEGYYC